MPTIRNICIHGDDATLVTSFNERPNIYCNVYYGKVSRNGQKIELQMNATLQALESSASYFAYEIEVSAKLDNTTKVLFTKPYGTSQWNTGDYAGAAKLTSKNVTRKCNIQFLVKIDCTCANAGKTEQFYYNNIAAPAYTQLTVKPNGGTYNGSSANFTLKRKEDYEYTLLNVTPPANMNFKGWTKTGGGSLSDSGQGSVFTFGVTNATITANYESAGYATLSFDANGGYGGPGPSTVPIGTSVTIPSGKPVKTVHVDFYPEGGTLSGYSSGVDVRLTFNSWTGSDGNTYVAGQQIVMNSNLTLTANWKEGTLNEFPDVIKYRARLNSWCTTPTGGQVYHKGSSISQDLDLYACWEYEVLLHGNGGIYKQSNGSYVDTLQLWTSPWAGTVSLNYVFIYQPTDPDANIIPTFVGYGESPKGPLKYRINGSGYKGKSYIDLYALYQYPEYKVSFWNGIKTDSKPKGDQIGKTQIVAYGENAKPPKNPTRPGYDFGGWIGSYKNVISDRDIVAYWGFSPIWVYHEGGWIVYTPVED